MRVVLALMLALTCPAQEGTASLTGIVTDATGAGIRATLLLEGSDDVNKTVDVDKSGLFAVEDLAPGTYKLQIRSPGFKPLQIHDVRLGPGEHVRLGSITLQLAPPECHEQICL